jgi:hypothetical protein
LKACLPAAKLALEDVNKREDILRGYHLNLAAKDDMVSFSEDTTPRPVKTSEDIISTSSCKL